MKNNWVNLVYDIYDFLYWEPQHIWKQQKKLKISHKDTIENIKKLEVSLNQILNIFFTFIPHIYIIELMSYIYKNNSINDNYEIYLDWDDNIAWIDWATQPDILFQWNISNMYIEMKIQAKMNIHQFFKYLLLHAVLESQEWRMKNMYFIILWKSDFASVWKERYQDIDILKNDFQNYKIPSKSKKWNIDIEKYIPRIYELSREVNIWFINYSWLLDFCEEKLTYENEVKTKYLLKWLIEELKSRKLR